MKFLLKPPTTEYDNYFDQSRFVLTWKINVFMFFMNLVLIPIFLFLSAEELFAMCYSSVLALVYQVVLYKTRKYKLISIIWVVNGILSTGISFLLVPSETHVLETIFMLMVTVYAFFTLGKNAGVLTIFGCLIFLTYYLIFKVNIDMEDFQPMSHLEITSTTLMAVYGFSITGYMILEFFSLNRFAEEQYIEANEKLEVSNEHIKKQDAEKSVMLKEIHHRVKNNLQVITSLLRLQIANENDENIIVKFNEAIRRVSSMSLIHEKIYQSEDLALFNFEDYLRSLSHDLIDSYALKQEVKFEINSAKLELSNRHFVPIALLCNELISNSLKHAFDNNQEALIKVKLKQNTKDRFILEYADNGTWKEGTRDSTFGIELIETLAEQLNGSFERVSNENGTTYKFDLNHLNE